VVSPPPPPPPPTPLLFHRIALQGLGGARPWWRKALVAQGLGGASLLGLLVCAMSRHGTCVTVSPGSRECVLRLHGCHVMQEVTPCNNFVLTSDRDEKVRVTRLPWGHEIAGYCLGHSACVAGVCMPYTLIIKPDPHHPTPYPGCHGSLSMTAL